MCTNPGVLFLSCGGAVPLLAQEHASRKYNSLVSLVIGGGPKTHVQGCICITQLKDDALDVCLAVPNNGKHMAPHRMRCCFRRAINILHIQLLQIHPFGHTWNTSNFFGRKRKPCCMIIDRRLFFMNRISMDRIRILEFEHERSYS